MLRRVFLLTAILAGFGCVSIPQKPYVVSSRGSVGSVTGAAECDAGYLASSAGTGEFRREGLDPAGFTLFSWNIKKNSRPGWRNDLALQARAADLLTLQEAHLTGSLKAALAEGDYKWDLAASFLYLGKETGVLTGAAVSAGASCVSRVAEPLVTVPKTALVSLYPVAGRERQLLVVNVHLVNLGSAGGGYRRQLEALEKLMADHEGPLILSGDFNTWSRGRLSAVAAMAERLALHEVLFAEGSPAAFFGRHVDHIYYRDLVAQGSRVMRVDSSDHYPLLVEFSLEEER